MIGPRSLFAALSLAAVGVVPGVGAAESVPTEPGSDRMAVVEESAPEELVLAGTGRDVPGVREDRSAEAASPTIRTAAARESDPGRAIDALPGREQGPSRPGGEGLQHMSWSGDHLVIGAGTLIVILLVLVLIT